MSAQMAPKLAICLPRCISCTSSMSQPGLLLLVVFVAALSSVRLKMKSNTEDTRTQAPDRLALFPLSSSEAHNDKLGMYQKMSPAPEDDDRVIYAFETNSDTYYLYFWGPSNAWGIGGDYSSEPTFFRSNEAAPNPQEAQEWYVMDDGWIRKSIAVVQVGEQVLEPLQAPRFRVLQYNILAKSLGNNEKPWFLYGAGLYVNEAGKQARAQVQAKHDAMMDAGRAPVFEEYAQDLTQAQRESIQKINEQDFAWDGTSNRGKRLALEIASRSPDVVILEEVDVFLDLFSMIDDVAALFGGANRTRISFSEDFSNTGTASAVGAVFDGFFAKRGTRRDGVAILWNKNRFTEKQGTRVRALFPNASDRCFGAVTLIDGDMGGQIKARRASRENITPYELVVIGTHLERNPEEEAREEVRKRQVSVLMESIYSEIHKLRKGIMDCGMVVGGDFNSDALEARWEDAVTGSAGSTEQYLKDAFSRWPKSADSPECTSRTESRHVWIDYVFFSHHTLHSKRESGPELCPDGDGARMPNPQHPSDHVPMEVDLAWGINTTIYALGSASAEAIA